MKNVPFSKLWAYIASILVHIVILVLLVWSGFQSKRDSESLPVALELWAPSEPGAAIIPAPQIKPTIVDQSIHSAVPETPSDVNLGRKRLAEPKVSRQPPQFESVGKEKLESKPKLEKKPMLLPKEARPKYQPNVSDLLAGLETSSRPSANAETNRVGNRVGTTGGGGDSTVKDEWIQKVKAKITPLVNIPLSMQGKDAKVVVQVTLLPSLEVNQVKLLQSSGSTVYDDAVQRAIWEAKVFPSLPPDVRFSDSYRQFRMEFRPE